MFNKENLQRVSGIDQYPDSNPDTIKKKVKKKELERLLHWHVVILILVVIVFRGHTHFADVNINTCDVRN